MLAIFLHPLHVRYWESTFILYFKKYLLNQQCLAVTWVGEPVLHKRVAKRACQVVCHKTCKVEWERPMCCVPRVGGRTYQGVCHKSCKVGGTAHCIPREGTLESTKNSSYTTLTFFYWCWNKTLSKRNMLQKLFHIFDEENKVLIFSHTSLLSPDVVFSWNKSTFFNLS